MDPAPSMQIKSLGAEGVERDTGRVPQILRGPPGAINVVALLDANRIVSARRIRCWRRGSRQALGDTSTGVMPPATRNANSAASGSRASPMNDDYQQIAIRVNEA